MNYLYRQKYFLFFVKTDYSNYFTIIGNTPSKSPSPSSLFPFKITCTYFPTFFFHLRIRHFLIQKNLPRRTQRKASPAITLPREALFSCILIVFCYPTHPLLGNCLPELPTSPPDCSFLHWLPHIPETLQNSSALHR